MTLQQKISLLTIIRNKTSCDFLECKGCFFEGRHEEFIPDKSLDNDEQYVQLTAIATRIALENNLITIEELFEEVL